MSVFSKGKALMEKTPLARCLNNEYLLAALASLVLLISMIVTSYQNCWGHIFSTSTDITIQASQYANSFYTNKYHVWYNSFGYYAIFLYFLAPAVLFRVYADGYYKKIDVTTVYRQGLRKYYTHKFFKALGLSAIVSGAAISVYALGLVIFATGGGLYIEGSGFEPLYVVVPSIYIFNDTAREAAINTPWLYMLGTFAVFFVSGISYCMYSYAVTNLFRSVILRLLLPFVGIIVIDFIVTSMIPDFGWSLAFDTFTPVCGLSIWYIVAFNLMLWVIAAVLLIVHYVRRRNNG